MSLHWKKQLFVAEYVAHPELSAAEIAVRCGYEPKFAKQRAYELMKHPDVKASIEEKQKDILAKVELTAEDVIKDILATRQRCVEEGATAWAMQGRLKCDELLGRYLRMWEEPKVEVNVGMDLAERLRKARAHVEGHVVVEEEPKALPAPVEVAEPVEVPRPRVEPARDYCPTGKPIEPPREEVDWVEKLL